MQSKLDVDNKAFFDTFNQTLTERGRQPFVTGRHADAHEFFSCLLSVLEAEDKSFTSDLNIRERIWLECQTCHMKWQAARDEVTPCITLKLDSSIEAVTLGHVVSQYCRWSLAPNLRCIICPSQTQIYKIHKIAGFTKSVIFNIGRFSYDQKRQRTIKVNARVIIPLAIDLELYDDNSRESYATESVSLAGVIVHIGRSAQSGHYIAALKNPNGVWYSYDDDLTRSIKIIEFLQTHTKNIYFAAYTNNSARS